MNKIKMEKITINEMEANDFGTDKIDIERLKKINKWVSKNSEKTIVGIVPSNFKIYIYYKEDNV